MIHFEGWFSEESRTGKEGFATKRDRSFMVQIVLVLKQAEVDAPVRDLASFWLAARSLPLRLNRKVARVLPCGNRRIASQDSRANHGLVGFV